MTAYNYSKCLDKILEYEGGFQNDPNDSGNWTGCKSGSGENRGTNRGISACSYPKEDIENMTLERAGEIYHDDYWETVSGDKLPAGVDLCTFDSGVNSGVSRGSQWLQRAVEVEDDGVVGPNTIKATRGADDHTTIDRMCDDRLNFLRGLSTWDLYGEGWTNRVEDVRATAHGMVKGTVPPFIPVPKVVRIKVYAPPGVEIVLEEVKAL